MDIRDPQLNMDKSEVLRYLGCNNQSVSEETSEMIDRLADHCLNIASPKSIYRRYRIEQSADSISLSESCIILPGEDIVRHLDGCRSCVVMAVTAGMAVERELIRLQRISMTEAVVFDACANVYVESYADCIQGEIARVAASEGEYITDRYSPGYGDFPLEMQKVLIPALECEKRIGLTVTDSALLIPHKSVTAVIGLRDTPADKTCRDCKNCNMYNTCTMRKNGDRCDK